MTRFACFVLLAVLLAGCGGKQKAAPTTTATPVDIASCNQLEGYIRLISQVVSGSVEAMTQSTHPRELGRRTAATQRNLASAANVLEQLALPPGLAAARRQLVRGLRLFSADFGRADISIHRDDLATAARQLVDRRALTLVSDATAKIDRACVIG
jgi:hypothetical protein